MKELYELCGLAYLGNFSNDMYIHHIYNTVGLRMLFSTLLWTLLHYYVIDHPRFFRGWQLALWILAIAGINFFAAYDTSTNLLDGIYIESTGDLAPYYSEFYTFSFIAMIVTLLAAIVWSLIIKWKRSPLAELICYESSKRKK